MFFLKLYKFFDIGGEIISHKNQSMNPWKVIVGFQTPFL
jgi:hypothetical protein